jgi:hypothetical protein
LSLVFRARRAPIPAHISIRRFTHTTAAQNSETVRTAARMQPQRGSPTRSSAGLPGAHAVGPRGPANALKILTDAPGTGEPPATARLRLMDCILSRSPAAWGPAQGSSHHALRSGGPSSHTGAAAAGDLAMCADFTVDIASKYIYRGYTTVLKHLPKLALLVVASSLGVGHISSTKLLLCHRSSRRHSCTPACFASAACQGLHAPPFHPQLELCNMLRMGQLSALWNVAQETNLTFNLVGASLSATRAKTPRLESAGASRLGAPGRHRQARHPGIQQYSAPHQSPVRPHHGSHP